jgi:hypothetical protein
MSQTIAVIGSDFSLVALEDSFTDLTRRPADFGREGEIETLSTAAGNACFDSAANVPVFPDVEDEWFDEVGFFETFFASEDSESDGCTDEKWFRRSAEQFMRLQGRHHGRRPPVKRVSVRFGKTTHQAQKSDPHVSKQERSRRGRASQKLALRGELADYGAASTGEFENSKKVIRKAPAARRNTVDSTLEEFGLDPRDCQIRYRRGYANVTFPIEGNRKVALVLRGNRSNNVVSVHVWTPQPKKTRPPKMDHWYDSTPQNQWTWPDHAVSGPSNTGILSEFHLSALGTSTWCIDRMPDFV